MPNLSDTNQSFRSHSSVFAFENKPEKMLNIWIFVPLKGTLVATFNETPAPTFRKYVAEQCILMPNLSETNKSFFSSSSVKKALKMLNFQTFLPLKELSVATFSETCALTSRKCAFEPGISIPNFLEKLQFFWLHSSVFDLEK